MWSRQKKSKAACILLPVIPQAAGVWAVVWGDVRGNSLRWEDMEWTDGQICFMRSKGSAQENTSLQMMVLQQPRILFFYFISNTHLGKESKYTPSCSTHGWKVSSNQVEANCLHSSVAFSALFAVSPILLRVMMKKFSLMIPGVGGIHNYYMGRCTRFD